MYTSDGLGLFKPFATLLILGGLVFWVVALVDIISPTPAANYPTANVPAPPAATYDGGQIDQISSELAGKKAHIRCDLAKGDERLGEAYVADSTANLTPKMCAYLAYFAKNVAAYEGQPCLASSALCPDARLNRALLAMHVLAHESYHLRGVLNEAETDCYGLQVVSYVAFRLGASQELAQALAHYYLRFYGPLRRAPQEYQTNECHDGSRLDLRPDDANWPG